MVISLGKDWEKESEVKEWMHKLQVWLQIKDAWVNTKSYLCGYVLFKDLALGVGDHVSRCCVCIQRWNFPRFHHEEITHSRPLLINIYSFPHEMKRSGDRKFLLRVSSDIDGSTSMYSDQYIENNRGRWRVMDLRHKYYLQIGDRGFLFGENNFDLF